MIRGFVEALRTYQIRGWALEANDPAFRLPVQISVGGRIIANTLADLHRHDLADAHLHDGRHGFVVNVGEALPLHRPQDIVVQVADREGRLHTLPAIADLAIERIDVASKGSMPDHAIAGFYAVAADHVRGWACDASRPDDHLTVAVEAGGRSLGQAKADLFREDLVWAGIGTGDHGFVIPLAPADRPVRAEDVSVWTVAANGARVPLRPAQPPPAARRQPPAAGDSKAPAERVFPSAHVDASRSPVIVLGAARSGTSAIAQALIGCGAYAGFPEGHFLELLGPLMQTASQFYASRAEEWSQGRATHLSVLPRHFVQQGLKHIILEGARQAFPTGDWVDKTPRAGMIALAPLLREIWPKARFVLMRRRAIENLDSRLRKFPQVDFEHHCREWALANLNWLAVVGKLAGAAIEIDQVYMAAHPRKVSAALGSFLGLSDQALERVSQALAFDQPERTAADMGAVSDLAALGWPESRVDTFRTFCGKAMHKMGYAEGSTYFLAGNETNGLVLR